MHRVSLVGVPGSGKSTLGPKIAAALGVSYVELDALYHQPGWNGLDRGAFRTLVSDVVAAEGWVVDGNYSQVQDIIWGRADTVVWIDLQKHIVMARVIRRTIRRALRREVLWNGNREPLSNFYRWDPASNIIRWTSLKYDDYAVRYGAAMESDAYPHLTFVRLRSLDAVIRFARDLARPSV